MSIRANDLILKQPKSIGFPYNGRMPETLVHTKLIIPPLRPNLVPRPRLVERLDQGLQPGLKLTLVSAPAGYGKTTSLAQWAHASQSPIAWLSLDQADNDFDRFFRYLVMAWEEVQPGVMESPLGLLLGSLTPDNEAVLAEFTNLANELPDHLVFILDDYHLIQEPSVLQALTFLLDHLPPKLHFVVAGRGEPPLPLARYRARGELQQLGTGDLRFRPEETNVFLKQRIGTDLSPKDIEPLQARLAGWVAGLQLLALAHIRGFVEPAVSGRQRFIADYLRAEVLDELLVLEDGQVIDVANVIWATGFHAEFPWIELPVLGEYEPLHQRGVVPSEPGLYFVGLHYLSAVSSAEIHGVERDAAHIAKQIADRTVDPKATAEASLLTASEVHVSP